MYVSYHISKPISYNTFNASTVYSSYLLLEDDNCCVDIKTICFSLMTKLERKRSQKIVCLHFLGFTSLFKFIAVCRQSERRGWFNAIWRSKRLLTFLIFSLIIFLLVSDSLFKYIYELNSHVKFDYV